MNAGSAGILKYLQVRIPMRDGVHLAANIFRPAEPGRVPTILVRTPYNKGRDLIPNYQAFVEHGYAVVVEDVRGRYHSEGKFDPLRQETADGDDTLNWIAGRSWSNGKIGMMGGSYLGIAQWKVAALNNPHLKAIFPVVSGYDDYRDRFYSTGGAMKLGNRLLWMSENMKVPQFRPDFSRFVLHLPLRSADQAATGAIQPMFQDAIRHPAYDSFWKALSTREKIGAIRVPAFIVGGWYDNFVESDLAAFTALRRTSGMSRILIGPWPHNMSSKLAVDYGADSIIPLRGLQMEWFDQWLKSEDTALVSEPPVRIFVMGANRWREERQWPPAGVRMTSFYLASEGRANGLSGNGTLGPRTGSPQAPDTFVYDPLNPVPTAGGPVCCNPKKFPWGPMDQRTVEKRPDVLVYTSPPLKRDLEVIGPVRVVLYTSTSARDTDFTAKLVDVFPGGEARNLTDGILRLRYRHSLEEPELATPGQVYGITIDAGVTGNVFLKGHRIRLEVSSSNFPRFDRNSNTGGTIAAETRLRKASQTIYHDHLHPSHLLLPVIP